MLYLNSILFNKVLKPLLKVKRVLDMRIHSIIYFHDNFNITGSIMIFYIIPFSSQPVNYTDRFLLHGRSKGRTLGKRRAASEQIQH
jgi:hypothetical protein